MELNHLKHFFEVAKSGSFAKASQRLRTSQSSLSKAVALLEESAHVKLFERSKSGVSLTAIGQEIFAKCENLFGTFADIEATCLGSAEGLGGPLRMGASDHVAKYLLIEPLQKIKKDHPDVEPSLFTAGPNEIVSSLLNGEIEFGLFFTKVPLPQIRYTEVASFPMAVVCHPELKPSFQGRLNPTEIKKHVKSIGLISSLSNRYAYNPSNHAIEQLGNPPINFEINSQEAQKQMCLAKGGVAVLARFMVADDLKHRRLSELPLRNPIALKLHIATRVGRSPSPVASAFLEIFKECQA